MHSMEQVRWGDRLLQGGTVYFCNGWSEGEEQLLRRTIYLVTEPLSSSIGIASASCPSSWLLAANPLFLSVLTVSLNLVAVVTKDFFVCSKVSLVVEYISASSAY